MSVAKWFRAFLPALSLWILLLVTWPLESIYLSRSSNEATLVASQLAQLLYVPAMAFAIAIAQPLSHDLAKLGGGRSLRDLAHDAVFGRESRAILDQYFALAIIPVALALLFAASAPLLARVLAADPAVRGEFVEIMRWRAAAIPIGYLAGMGDYVSFAVGLPALANLVVVVEAAVYSFFVFVLGGALVSRFGFAAGQVASIGLVVKFLSTVSVYAAVFTKTRVLRGVRIPKRAEVVNRFRRVFQNGLIGISTETAHCAASPIVGHVAALDATLITMVERVGLVFTSFISAQRQFLFARGGDEATLQRDMWRSLAYVSVVFVPLSLGAVLAWRAFGERLNLSPEAVALGLLPLVLRLGALFLEVVVSSLLTVAVIFPESRSGRLKPGTITLITNWVLWIPGVWILYLAGKFNVTTYALSLVLVLGIQLALARFRPTQAAPLRAAAAAERA